MDLTRSFATIFFFLPQAVEGIQAGEITRFRTDDGHELCDPGELHLKSEITKLKYILKIFIPSNCLNGYDPGECNHLGFSYRVNRYGGMPQHFSVVSDEFAFEQQPALWSRADLIHENTTIRKSSKKKR